MIIKSGITKAFLKKSFSKEEIEGLVEEIMLGQATYQCYLEGIKGRVSEINIVDAFFYSNREEFAIDLLEKAMVINDGDPCKDRFLLRVIETSFKHGKYDLLVKALSKSPYAVQLRILGESRFINLGFDATKKVMEELMEKQDKKDSVHLMRWLPEIIVRGRNKWEIGDQKIECFIDYAKRVKNVSACGFAFKNSYSDLMSQRGQTKNILAVFKKILNGPEEKIKVFWAEISDALRLEVVIALNSEWMDEQDKVKEVNEIRRALKEVNIEKIPFSVFVDGVMRGIKKEQSIRMTHHYSKGESDEDIMSYYLEFVDMVDCKDSFSMSDSQKKEIERWTERYRSVFEKILLASQIGVSEKTKLRLSISL